MIRNVGRAGARPDQKGTAVSHIELTAAPAQPPLRPPSTDLAIPTTTELDTIPPPRRGVLVPAAVAAAVAATVAAAFVYATNAAYAAVAGTHDPYAAEISDPYIAATAGLTAVTCGILSAIYTSRQEASRA